MNRMGLIVDKGSLKKTVQVPFYCRWRSLLLLLLHSPLWNFCHWDKQDWIDWRAMKLHSLGSTQSLLSLTHTIVVTDTGSSGNQPSQQSIKEEEGSQDYWLLEESGEGKSLSFVYPLLNRAGSDGSFKPVVTQMALANLNGSQNKMNSHKYEGRSAGRRMRGRGGGQWEWSECFADVIISKRKEWVEGFNLLNIPRLPGNVLTTLNCSI